MGKKISIIVPVLNEEHTLESSLTTLDLEDDVELIVVDGGSADGTVKAARKFTDRVLITGRGRAHQMNYGAAKADGEIFHFLHSDCRLPGNGLDIIRETLEDGNIAAGAFDLKIDHTSFCFRVIETGANIRSRLTSIPYGDQGIFMRRAVFEEIGGFAEIPLMEDIEMGRRLRRMGRIRFVRPPITTSPRRWLAEGLLYTTLRDWSLALSYSVLNIPPERLVRYYRDVR